MHGLLPKLLALNFMYNLAALFTRTTWHPPWAVVSLQPLVSMQYWISYQQLPVIMSLSAWLLLMLLRSPSVTQEDTLLYVVTLQS